MTCTRCLGRTDAVYVPRGVSGRHRLVGLLLGRRGGEVVDGEGLGEKRAMNGAGRPRNARRLWESDAAESV